MIKAVIFDWGGVLIEYTDNKLMDYCSNYLKVKRDIFENIFSRYKEDFQRGVIEEKDLWKKICRELKTEIPKTKSLWGGN